MQGSLSQDSVLSPQLFIAALTHELMLKGKFTASRGPNPAMTKLVNERGNTVWLRDLEDQTNPKVSISAVRQTRNCYGPKTESVLTLASVNLHLLEILQRLKLKLLM